MNKVYKLPPCSIYDVPAMETWLSDMSRAGLHLNKACRRYLVFLKGESWNTCYRMEPVTLFLISSPILLAILADAALGMQAVQQALELRSLKRSLSDGLPAAHEKDYHDQLRLYRLLRFGVSLLTLLVILAIPAASFLLNWEKTVSEVDTELPYLPLDVIEEGQADFSWRKDQNTQRGVDSCNKAAYTWSLFVPVHYDIYQQGEVQNIYKIDEAANVDPSAYTEYFQVILPAFAAPLYREQVRCYIRLDTNPVVTEPFHPAFDHVTIAKAEGLTQLFAYRGRQVIHIRYWGDADLAGRLDLLADALE